MVNMKLITWTSLQTLPLTFQHIAKGLLTKKEKKEKIKNNNIYFKNVHWLSLKTPIHHHTILVLFSCMFTSVPISCLSNVVSLILPAHYLSPSLEHGFWTKNKPSSTPNVSFSKTQDAFLSILSSVLVTSIKAKSEGHAVAAACTAVPGCTGYWIWVTWYHSPAKQHLLGWLESHQHWWRNVCKTLWRWKVICNGELHAKFYWNYTQIPSWYIVFAIKCLIKILKTLFRNAGLNVSLLQKQMNITQWNYEGDHFSLLSFIQTTEGRFVQLHACDHVLSY